MTYTPPEGVTIGTFTADTLPASFNAPADAGISYKIYGTEAGVGTATSEGEPAGYKITLTVDGTPIPIYIGESMLGKEEYLVFSEQKVYKRTENLLNPENAVSDYAVTTGPVLTPTEGYSVVYIPCNPSTRYTGYNLATTTSGSNRLIGFCDINKNLIGSQPYSVTAAIKPINTTSDTYYIAATVETALIGVSAMIIEGSDVPESYIPYFQPTDPPVPLPHIITYDGENTISSTETLGDVELTGEWTAIMGSTEDESIDIGFTVDAEEYIAFVTIDDGPSIQVSDTITMPSSADSFSLEVVAWGRERYTDTVYNALS